MRLHAVWILWVLLLSGCGPDKRMIAKSQVEKLCIKFALEDGRVEPMADPWGTQVEYEAQMGDVYKTFEVRSAGPDTLPYTNDDIVAVRSVKHTAITKAGGKALENLGSGVTKGLIKGIKSGWRLKGEED